MAFDWKSIKAAQERMRTLPVRLAAGDDLHQEALEEIKRLKIELREAHKEVSEAARDGYAQAKDEAAMLDVMGERW